MSNAKLIWFCRKEADTWRKLVRGQVQMAYDIKFHRRYTQDIVLPLIGFAQVTRRWHTATSWWSAAKLLQPGFWHDTPTLSSNSFGLDNTHVLNNTFDRSRTSPPMEDLDSQMPHNLQIPEALYWIWLQDIEIKSPSFEIFLYFQVYPLRWTPVQRVTFERLWLGVPAEIKIASQMGSGSDPQEDDTSAIFFGIFLGILAMYLARVSRFSSGSRSFWAIWAKDCSTCSTSTCLK